jgi:hypothetical protein
MRSSWFLQDGQKERRAACLQICFFFLSPGVYPTSVGKGNPRPVQTASAPQKQGRNKPQDSGIVGGRCLQLVNKSRLFPSTAGGLSLMA